MDTETTRPLRLTIIIEDAHASILSDTFTYLTAAAVFAPGVIADSPAMQWTGAAMFFIILLGKSSKFAKRVKSFAEAREAIDALEKEAAQ